MIDLRKEMEELLNENGYYLLIQRASNIFQCSCTYGNKEQLFNNTEKYCEICNNTGKVIKIEKYLGIRQERDSNFIEKESIGYTDLSVFEFYFSHDKPIAENDKIYEVGWKKNIPVTLHNIYEVKHVEKPRGDNGRIEYVMAIAERSNINLSKLQRDFIKNIRAYKNSFIKGGN